MSTDNLSVRLQLYTVQYSYFTLVCQLNWNVLASVSFTIQLNLAVAFCMTSLCTASMSKEVKQCYC